MLIRSMAGDFEITIERFETEQGKLVMIGRMGVWDARTYITPRELIVIFGKLLRPRMLPWILGLPFLFFTKAANEPVKQEEPSNE